MPLYTPSPEYIARQLHNLPPADRPARRLELEPRVPSAAAGEAARAAEEAEERAFALGLAPAPSRIRTRVPRRLLGLALTFVLGLLPACAASVETSAPETDVEPSLAPPDASSPPPGAFPLPDLEPDAGPDCKKPTPALTEACGPSYAAFGGFPLACTIMVTGKPFKTFPCDPEPGIGAWCCP